MKIAYWLSDVSATGRGNFQVVPGSHTTNWIDGPPRRDKEWPDPEGAIEVTADPGDLPGLTPVQRQLVRLEDGDGDHAWGHYPSEVPLYGLLKDHDLLDPKHPPLKP